MEATASLRSGTESTGTTVTSELLARGWTQSATSFQEQWKARQEAVGALSTYARSLQELSRAGNSGEEAVGSLGDALGELASGVGLAMPAAGATAASEIVGVIYGQIARARARKELAEALSLSQPVVEGVVAKLQADMADLARILDIAVEDAQGDLDFEYDVELEFRRALLEQRKRLYEGDPPAASDTARVKAIQVNASLLASTDDWYADYEGLSRAMSTRAAAGKAVLESTKEAVGAFALVHQRFVDAVVDERSFDAGELVEATRRLRDLIDGLRGS